MTSLQSHLLRMLGGCTAVLLSLLIGPVVAAESQLLLRPSQERFSSGDRIWCSNGARASKCCNAGLQLAVPVRARGWTVAGTPAMEPRSRLEPISWVGLSHGDATYGSGWSLGFQRVAVG